MSFVDVRNLRKSFITGRDLLGRPSARVDAVDDVSFAIERGETVAIVGETGAGKSTVGRLVLRLERADSGTVMFDSIDLLAAPAREVRALRRRAQMIFQDPFSSLDPRMTVRASIGEPFKVHRLATAEERESLVEQAILRVGLRRDQLDRYPREFSGGQLQRIAIARALTTNPDFIVCDEPVAALDLSIQAQVLNLLLDLQQERNLAYLFISHDLSVVRFLAHRVIVMSGGQIIEAASTEEIFSDPKLPYTRQLIAAAPTAKPSRAARKRDLANTAGEVAP